MTHVVKERIKVVWVNTTISQLNKFFKDNLDGEIGIVIIYAQLAIRS